MAGSETPAKPSALHWANSVAGRDLRRVFSSWHWKGPEGPPSPSVCLFLLYPSPTQDHMMIDATSVCVYIVEAEEMLLAGPHLTEAEQPLPLGGLLVRLSPVRHYRETQPKQQQLGTLMSCTYWGLWMGRFVSWLFPSHTQDQSLPGTSQGVSVGQERLSKRLYSTAWNI